MDNIPDCQYDYKYERPQATIVDRCCMCGGDIFEVVAPHPRDFSHELGATYVE
jgi:rRNA maturation protein Nop10